MGGAGEMARPLETIGQRIIVRTRISATNKPLPNTREFACRSRPLLTISCDGDLELDESSFRPQAVADRAI